MFAEMFLVKTLREDPGVQAILGGGGAPGKTMQNVGTRIMPFRSLESVMPVITYQATSGECDVDLPFQRVLLKVRCWDDNYAVAKQLSTAVKNALHKKGGTIGTTCNYIWNSYCENPDVDEFNQEANKYTVYRIFEIIVQE